MADVLDQSNATGATGIGFGDTGNSRDYMGQGFIPTLSNISAISLKLSTVGTMGLLVWIDNADANFFPTGAVGVGIGGVTEILNSALVAATLTKYSLSAPVTLIPGQRYVIMFAPWDTSNHVFSADYRDVVSSSADPYASGKRIHGNGAYNSFAAPDSGTDDILFEEYSNRIAHKINNYLGISAGNGMSVSEKIR